MSNVKPVQAATLRLLLQLLDGGNLRIMQLLSNALSPRLDPERTGLVPDPYYMADEELHAALLRYAQAHTPKKETPR